MLWALIMAGGRGTRLWPVANQKNPKPLLELLPGKKTLLEETLKRVSLVAHPKQTFIFTGSEYRSQILKYSKQIPQSQIVGEKVSRNTAPTIAIAASLIAERDPEATLLVLPADHWIEPLDQFRETVNAAAEIAKKHGSFVIFGVKPTHSSTSYGYLQPGKKMSARGFELKRFVEKPDIKRAKKFLKAGYLWHAGIFLAPVKTILNSFECFAPRISDIARRLEIQNGHLVPERTFRLFSDISIDYAVLEKLKKAYLIQTTFNWCDVGTWQAFGRLWPNDASGNAFLGKAIAHHAQDNIVYSKDKPVHLFGVNDLVVVNTPETLLITRKDCAESIRKISAEMGD